MISKYLMIFIVMYDYFNLKMRFDVLHEVCKHARIKNIVRMDCIL